MCIESVAEAPTLPEVPAVSVIIPLYNVAEFIAETLNSVFSQTFQNFEVICVNDGSPDTKALEEAMASHLGRVKYVKQENRGAGAARNTALNLARGEYVAFLDGDDAWLPTYLEQQMAIADEGYDLVYANALLIGDSVWAGKTYMDRDPSEGPCTFEALIGERCLVITSGVIARRKLILDVGGFDESLRNSQDFDLWVKLAKHANARMTYQRKVLLKHRVHAGSLASDAIKSVEGELRVLYNVREWPDLSKRERETLERTIALRNASVSVDRGKRALMNGEFDVAAQAFQLANNYYRSFKLRGVLFLLRFAPRLLRTAYRTRAT